MHRAPLNHAGRPPVPEDMRSTKPVRTLAALCCILISGCFPIRPAHAEESTLPLGGRDWRIQEQARGAPSVSTPRDDASSRVVTDATLELREPPGEKARGALALAVTFKTLAGDSCVKLEIGFGTANAASTPLDRVGSECATAPGHWQQLAIAARAAKVGETAVYRITVHGAAQLVSNDVQAGALGERMGWLRARVAAGTLAALDAAIAKVKERAVYASRVDWPLATAQALAGVLDGSSGRDALPGVQIILRSLGDKHSWATVVDDQGRMTAHGQALQYQAPSARLARLESDRVVGWLEIPRLGAVSGRETHLFAQAIHAGLAESVKAGACGYVVDLAGNTGGNMWPGLDGLGPLFGDGAVVGSFKLKSGSFAWTIDKDDIGNRMTTSGLADPAGLWRAELPRAPIAVIVDHWTASSGEAIAIAFSGRPQTRFFGHRSYGVATSTEMIALGDGLTAFVVTGAMADRDGRTFPIGIAPETEDADDDAAAAHALAWLGTTPNCARAGSP
jgi:carboxyl-terminal processing protease